MKGNADEFGPCVFGQHEDGTFSLAFPDFDATSAVFEEMDLDGGGYGWHAAVDALVRMKVPKLKRKLSYDPEASMLVVLSKDRDALKQVAALIREAARDHDVLREALENADSDLMD